GGKPLVKACQGVDAEEPEEAGEPPGVIDVGEAQPEKPTVGVFSVFLDIRFWPLALLDDRPDGRRDRDKQEQEHGQLDRRKKLDQLTRKFLPPHPRRRGTRSILLGQCFGPAVHSRDASRSSPNTLPL